MNNRAYQVSIAAHIVGHKKAPPGEGEASVIIGGSGRVFYCLDVVGGFIPYGASVGERDPVGVEAPHRRESDALVSPPSFAPVDPPGVSLGERRE